MLVVTILSCLACYYTTLAGLSGVQPAVAFTFSGVFGAFAIGSLLHSLFIGD
jgi:hypothetical protein